MKPQNQIIFGVCAFLMVINSANSLRCYRCSSDAGNGEFCRDPFEKDKLKPDEKNMSEADCKPQSTHFDSQTNAQYTPVCKKIVQKNHGNHVVQRSCYFIDVNDKMDCKHSTETTGGIETLFCEYCRTDYCNNAGMYAPVFTLVILPALIAKIFSL